VPNPAGNGLFGMILAAGQGDRQGGSDMAAVLAGAGFNPGPASAGAATQWSAAPPIPGHGPALPHAVVLQPTSARATSHRPMNLSGHGILGTHAIATVFAQYADVSDGTWWKS
jgi:hypothetical protein